MDIQVYGLTGRSGTGKSYQSMNICRDRDIESIIDDGLFIYRNTVMAGHSAKRDENKMTAVKTAIFYDENLRKSVSEKIREVAPKSILIIGTSESMVRKIQSRLELPEIMEMIHIEDVVDEDAIATALRQRRERGKHVIPVPTVEIKGQFSGYFMVPLKMIRNISERSNRYADPEKIEKSVVRPTYSYLGEFSISNKAVHDLILYAARLSKDVVEVLQADVKKQEQGVLLEITVILEYGKSLPEMVEHLQQTVAEEVERMTAFQILGVDVIVRDLRRTSFRSQPPGFRNTVRL